MQTSQVKNPPHLCVDYQAIRCDLIPSSNLNNIDRRVIRTSTPVGKEHLVNIMELSFTKLDRNILDFNVQIDNDSGYVSNNQESNSDSALESLNASGRLIMPSAEVKSVYLSEDALLETPEIFAEPQAINSSIPDEENEVVEASTSADTKIFSALQNSIQSNISDKSDVIQIVSPILAIGDYINQNEYCDRNTNSDVQNINNFNSDIQSTEVKDMSSYYAEDFCDNYKQIYETSSCCDNSLLSCSQGSDFSTRINNDASHYQFKEKEQESENHPFNCMANTSGVKTPQKLHKNPGSPDLFSDEEITEQETVEVSKTVQNQVSAERYVLKQDRKLIRRMQGSFCGVLPPPSLTMMHLTVEQMLHKIYTNKHLFWNSDNTNTSENLNVLDKCMVLNRDENYKTENKPKSTCDNDSLNLSGSLLVTASSFENCVHKQWPDVLQERFHGLHYNRSKYSEEFEQLCMKYATRYVGSETQSSCTVFESNVSSPLKRKASRLRWGAKSPGRRLSHLARRRITFSSANIQANSNGASSNTRQVVIDARRFDLLSRRRSPKKKSPKKTPRKSPKKKIRTPSSSAKKRLSLHLQMISEDRENSSAALTALRASTTKRALFQSPDHNRSHMSLSKPLCPGTSNSGLSPFKKRVNPRCALFVSPTKSSPSKRDSKRKRLDSEDAHPSKLARTLSMPENPLRASKPLPISRLRSDSVLSTVSSHSGELSAHHKKKLQWAVYESLRTQNIGINHPQFKQFASVLARVTRRFLPNLSANAPRPEGGTSERMLRIARQHVYAVSKGKTVDEIMQEVQQSKFKHQKPSGYVNLQQGVRSDVSTAKNKENIFRDKLNTMASETKFGSGLNRQDLIKTNLTKSENRVDRVRKIINFDDEPQVGHNSSIR